MPQILNWKRRRCGWTDGQNAKFMSLVNGKGDFVVFVISPRRFIGCKEDELALYLTRFRGGSYEYPLQEWIAPSYVLYNQGVSQPYPSRFTRSIEMFVSKEKPVSNGLEVSVATVYLREHFAPSTKVLKRLRQLLDASGIWDLFYRTAHTFISTNRPNEVALFERIYPTMLPRDCFVNVYDVGISCGINPHRDHVSFCTVVLCLVGSNEGNLKLLLDTGEEVTISMKTNDIVVFARIQHSVGITMRTHKRITINAFY